MSVSVWQIVIIVLALAGAGFVYFIPSIVAGSRDHPNTTVILVLNLLAGWTFLGWLGALIWALNNAPAARRAESDRRLACPHCAEPILPAAKICPHCRSALAPPPTRIRNDRLSG